MQCKFFLHRVRWQSPYGTTKSFYVRILFPFQSLAHCSRILLEANLVHLESLFETLHNLKENQFCFFFKENQPVFKKKK